MERSTVDIYEGNAAAWRDRRPARFREQAAAFAARCDVGAIRLDAGSGPGIYLPDLGRPAVALDAAFAMVELGRQTSPDVPAIQADLEALPFRRGALGGAWARASYLHVPKVRLPLALARLHHCLKAGAPVHITLRRGHTEGPLANDDFPGRFFAEWETDELAAVIAGAGFVIDELSEPGEWVQVAATCDRTLPDFVGPGMRVLVCGLNPSVIAADAGFGYATPSNRFWRAAVASGLVSSPRDPWTALERDGTGMTDLVKRATPRAAALTQNEYVAGAERVKRLVEWLSPQLVLFVGLEGWRASIDRKAVPGWQAEQFGGARAYVMPSTSGLNAHSQLDALTEHMKAALAQA